MTEKIFADIHNELIQIKRLLILQAIKGGADGTEIAHALKVTKARISQLFPVNKIKKGVHK